MSRWVRIQVDIHEHSVFAPEPFTEREAWQWMICRAAWKETAHRVGASVHKVPVGSFFATVREMQAVWKWTSTRRVAQFLNLLSEQNMIETRSETGKTLVTVCNYSRYQNVETPSETPQEPNPKQERNTKDTSLPEHQGSPGLLSEREDCDLDPTTLESKLRDAAGEKMQPHGGFVVGPVMELVRAGADIDLDVLPAIRAVAARLNRPARSWDYFVPAIQDAMDKRKAAATWEHRAQAPPGQRPPSAAMQRHERIRQNLKREIYGDENADDAGHVIDLTERDYRPH